MVDSTRRKTTLRWRFNADADAALGSLAEADADIHPSAHVDADNHDSMLMMMNNYIDIWLPSMQCRSL